ncbi:hypothetical protein ACFL96_04085 [Thermoproteota archaeon]
MLGVRYKGLRIEVSRSANHEMLKENLDIYDVLEVLEQGYEPSKRRKDIVERCLVRGRKVIKAVVGLNHRKEESYWTLIHAGRFTKK